jgi:hypothetical protein
VVTFTNTLGAIASRSDITQAERNRTKADEADSRAELARITRERDGLAFTPTTDDAVKAARAAVVTSERIRLAECGNGDPKQRGPNCRQRETEEQGKRQALAHLLTNKALTERAAQLDTDAACVRAQLARSPKVQNANPLGAVRRRTGSAERNEAEHDSTDQSVDFPQGRARTRPQRWPAATPSEPRRWRR